MRRVLVWLGGSLLLVVVVAGVVAVIGSYTFLPAFFEDRIATSVQDDYNLAEKPEVDLRSDPPPRMLLGDFSGGEVVMESANFGGLTAESVDIGLGPFDADIPRSIREGGIVASGEDTGPLRVVISEAEVQRLARLEAGVQDVRLENGSVVITRSESLLGYIELPVEVTGGLSLDGRELAFRPERLSVAGIALPRGVEESLLADAGTSFPLEDVPPGVTLDAVEVEGDRLVVTGETPTGLAGS